MCICFRPNGIKNSLYFHAAHSRYIFRDVREQPFSRTVRKKNAPYKLLCTLDCFSFFQHKKKRGSAKERVNKARRKKAPRSGCQPYRNDDTWPLMQQRCCRLIVARTKKRDVSEALFKSVLYTCNVQQQQRIRISCVHLSVFPRHSISFFKKARKIKPCLFL